MQSELVELSESVIFSLLYYIANDNCDSDNYSLIIATTVYLRVSEILSIPRRPRPRRNRPRPTPHRPTPRPRLGRPRPRPARSRPTPETETFAVFVMTSTHKQLTRPRPDRPRPRPGRPRPRPAGSTPKPQKTALDKSPD